MPTPNTDPADFIGLVVAIVTYFGNKEIALIVGPYIGICIAAMVAAGWALSKAGELTGWQSIRFMLLRVGTAVIFAVTLAEGVHAITPTVMINWMVVPFAFCIALVKDRDELKEYISGFLDLFRKKDKDA